VILDRSDNDWSWVVQGRDQYGAFTGIALEVGISTAEEAREQLVCKMEAIIAAGATVFPRED
jgi:hypothetical protein